MRPVHIPPGDSGGTAPSSSRNSNNPRRPIIVKREDPWHWLDNDHNSVDKNRQRDNNNDAPDDNDAAVLFVGGKERDKMLARDEFFGGGGGGGDSDNNELKLDGQGYYGYGSPGRYFEAKSATLNDEQDWQQQQNDDDDDETILRNNQQSLRKQQQPPRLKPSPNGNNNQARSSQHQQHKQRPQSDALLLSCEVGDAASNKIRVTNTFTSEACDVTASFIRIDPPPSSTNSTLSSSFHISPISHHLVPGETGLFELVFTPTRPDEPPSLYQVTLSYRVSGGGGARKSSSSFRQDDVIRFPIQTSILPTATHLPMSSSSMLLSESSSRPSVNSPHLLCSHRMLDFGDSVDPITGSLQTFSFKNVSRHIIAFTVRIIREEPKRFKHFNLVRQGGEYVLDPNDECQLTIELVPEPSVLSTSVAYSCVVSVFARVFAEVDGQDQLFKKYSLLVRGKTQPMAYEFNV